MESMNISLPEQLRDFVLKQVESGYGSASEYIRELIRADERVSSRKHLRRSSLMDLPAVGAGNCRIMTGTP